MTGKQINRRKALAWLAIGVTIPVGSAHGSPASAQDGYRVHYSKDEWRRRLTAVEFSVLREEATERAFTSPLNKEKRSGTFVCAGCGNELYSSSTKYDSGTGWPSFYRAIDANAVGYSTDDKLGYPRREVHCADCGGHLGHVFDDGPPPTGKRHCINGVAMDFRPA